VSKTLSTASLTVSFSLLPVSSTSALAASSAFSVSAAADWTGQALGVSRCVYDGARVRVRVPAESTDSDVLSGSRRARQQALSLLGSQG